jgi:hypothetical protein
LERSWIVVLDQELVTFQRELPRLLREQPGRYALVQGDTVDSIWDTEDAAVEAGDDRFGLKPFLVKKIQAHEKPLVTHANVIPRCQS